MIMDRLASIFGFIVALVICSLIAWLVFSAVVSFVRLEWTTATETGVGRAAFVCVVTWLAMVMLRDHRP